MTYMGEGLYSYTFKNVPAANYEYKIALGDWSENYGAGGVISGSNIAVTVTCYCREQEFWQIQDFLTAD